MKLIIQIPCRNEEQVLPTTLAALPRTLPGVGKIEILIIDDGSTDQTVKIAQENGVDHIVRLTHHVGLAGGFVAGLEAGLSRGADLIVNTDADNQYNAEDIGNLIKPIFDGQADIVIGDRGVASLQSFSPLKRFLQRIGSWIIAQASGIRTPDATSGFRAFSRQAALTAYRLGQCFGAYYRGFGAKRISLGRDCRLSSPELRLGVLEGIMDAGMDVKDLGMVPTPLLYFSLHHLDVDGGIQITGSHNPPEYNGFKICLGKTTIYGKEIQKLSKDRRERVVPERKGER